MALDDLCDAVAPPADRFLALRMLLAAVEPAQDAERRTPTPTPPSEEDPFLLFAPMCGIGGAAAPWAPAKVAFFFHALGKVPAHRPCLPARPATACVPPATVLACPPNPSPHRSWPCVPT